MKRYRLYSCYCSKSCVDDDTHDGGINNDCRNIVTGVTDDGYDNVDKKEKKMIETLDNRGNDDSNSS